ncbi:MAG: ABC transporter ATP-binding protein [Oliverpabstia sp.]
MSEPILKVDNLKTYFFLASGVAKAVDGVSFSLNKGETLGIVGESGSGKSVTAKSIIRLLESVGKIVDGSIEFEGKDILKMNDKELMKYRGKDASMIFQDPMTSLDPVFKVGYQMIENLRAHNDISREDARKICIEALRSVGIPQPEVRFDSYAYELSGGMCQRVIIAMALCSGAKLIIADEPTTALDVTVQAQVLKLLKQLQEQKDMALLLITHNLGVVWEMCDKVMVMYAGKTVEYTETGVLYQNPLHPYTWGLLDSMPSLELDAQEQLNTIKGTPPDLRLTGTCCNFYNRCPYARPVCAQCVPDTVEVEPGHFVACHFQTREKHLVRGEVNQYEG